MKVFLNHALTMACVGFLLPAATAHAEVDLHSRNLAASCAACHGTNGRSVGGTPVLAGLDKTLFVAYMKEFKTGARPSTVMYNHAKGYTDEEFGKLADFFAAQSR